MRRRRKKSPLTDLRLFKVWSNTFYLAPLVTAMYYGLPITAALTFGVAFFGSLYHLSHERKTPLWLWPDFCCSWLLILTNLVLCYLGKFGAPYFYIALLFLGLALFYNYYLSYKGQYSLNHGLWHLYGSLITLFCIFTYAL